MYYALPDIERNWYIYLLNKFWDFSGYFVVDGRLYCEVHAKQIAQPPGPNMKAVPVYRWKK